MIAFALGLFFGSCLGFFVASLLQSTKDPETRSAFDVGLGFPAEHVDDDEIPIFIRHRRGGNETSVNQ
jgi:hypothetical protein